MQLAFFTSQIVASVVLVLLSAVTESHASNYFYGVTASNSKPNSGYNCRTQADWNSLASTARSNGFSSIRVVGFDCNALDLASSAAAANGLTVLAGIYFGGTVAQDMVNINNDVQTFRAAYNKYGSGRFKGLTVGNEANDSPGNVAAKVADVRGYLGSIGINTPVSTVHNWVAIRDNPAAYCIGDFVGANAHAFYDQNTVSGNAGNFVWNTVIPALRSRCPGKPIIISETGWPSRGGTNGQAVASSGDQRSALINLNCVAAKNDRSISVYAFEADDQTWKGNDWERSFGIFGKINFSGDINNQC
ncbi:hypothetical protein D9611_005021 [Ephemerocybe angulata]|uniref:glucan endo-1,3-beta-D-glucosidase n=1 Tax=Ephemerocybe angulata TaxID=980116 RepID=A0A8H5B4E2_9AGAR|nr:hypothetical protein D9611_005021 [Tulosesus angulatus]